MTLLNKQPVSVESLLTLELFRYSEGDGCHKLVEHDRSRPGHISWLRANALEEAGLIRECNRIKHHRMFEITDAGVRLLEATGR